MSDLPGASILVRDLSGMFVEYPVFQGKSAYQSYLDTTTDNPKLTEAEWSAKLKLNNTLESVVVGEALDSTQGKILNDKITGVVDSLSNFFVNKGVIDGTLDWNTFTTSGAYQTVAVHGANGPVTYGYGVLVIFAAGANGVIVQLYFPHEASSLPKYRLSYNSVWLSWRNL